MRREDKRIIDRQEVDQIISGTDVCRIAFADNNTPYIVPVSFGYDGENIFIHTAKAGRKIDFIKKNNTICFEFEADVNTIDDKNIPCKWTTAYKSVIGYGSMIELTGFADQERAINQIMLHYSGKKWEFNQDMLKGVKLWKIEIDSISGKQSGY
jgi:nitroimidazol reductase NimA-like FMN-containing flavoprotein (pyridoxamine 5'-phosphate oxidase superfamily)